MYKDFFGTFILNVHGPYDHKYYILILYFGGYAGMNTFKTASREYRPSKSSRGKII